MKLLTKRIIMLSIILVSFNLYSQSTSLKINFYQNDFENEFCFSVKLYNDFDTIKNEIIYEDDVWEIDSLKPGKYYISLTNCSTDKLQLIQSITKTFYLKENKLTEIIFNEDDNNNIELDTTNLGGIIKERNEIQFRISYFDKKWSDYKNCTKYTIDLGYSGYYWNSFSKHIGLLIGGGIGFSYAPITIDNNVYKTNQKEIIYDYSNYMTKN